MTDLDPLTQAMYAQGSDGIHIAEVIITAGIAALITVQNGRADNPTSFPGYPTDATPHAAARMITSQLLNAGWRPPDTEALTAPDDARQA